MAGALLAKYSGEGKRMAALVMSTKVGTHRQPEESGCNGGHGLDFLAPSEGAS